VEQAAMLERVGSVWSGGEQATDAMARALQLGRELGLGANQELRTLGKLITLRARWTGSIGRQVDGAERDREYAEVERLLDGDVDDDARVHGLLAMGFRPMSVGYTNASMTDLGTSHGWAQQALALARKLDDPDTISSAVDGISVAAFGDDRMRDVLEYNRERVAILDRLSAGERADSLIVDAWAECILGNLETAERAADAARAGLTAGQASNWVLGATAWRILALGALGRWDEALSEGVRAERAWAESELQAPGYAVSGLLAAHAVSRARGDVVGAAHYRELIERIHARSDPSIRNRRLAAILHDDWGGLSELVDDFRLFTPRLDYLYLVLAHLADHRKPAGLESLDRILEYTDERGLRLISTQALRLRGILNADRADLEAALAQLRDMGAKPYVARVEAELGLMVGDQAMVEEGLDELARLGDLDQSARVAAERKAAAVRAS
jgi:hypothetical protein